MEKVVSEAFPFLNRKVTFCLKLGHAWVNVPNFKVLHIFGVCEILLDRGVEPCVNETVRKKLVPYVVSVSTTQNLKFYPKKWHHVVWNMTMSGILSPTRWWQSRGIDGRRTCHKVEAGIPHRYGCDNRISQTGWMTDIFLSHTLRSQPSGNVCHLLRKCANFNSV